jgi:hypothetical protein
MKRVSIGNKLIREVVSQVDGDNQKWEVPGSLVVES